MRKLILIGASNGINSQSTDQNGNLNVEVPVKVVDIQSRSNGETVDRTQWVRVTAIGTVAEKLSAIGQGEDVYIEGIARFDNWTAGDRINAFVGVSAQRVVKVGKAEEHSITLIADGNLGRDPEMRYTPSGAAVTNFSLGMNSRREETMWGDVSCWQKTAEAANQYLSKGRKVLVEGKPSVHRWTGNDGVERARLQVNANSVEFLGGGRSNEDGSAGGYSGYGSYGGGEPAQSAQEPQGEDDMPW